MQHLERMAEDGLGRGKRFLAVDSAHVKALSCGPEPARSVNGYGAARRARP